MRAMLLGIYFLVLGLAVSSRAQTFGEITGEISDSTGGVVVGATVTVTNPQTSLTRQTTTNTAGNYAFPALLPGVYNVKANTRILTPSLVNEFRFGYSGFYNDYANELQLKRDPIKEFGIGLIDPAPVAWGTPGVTILGFSGFRRRCERSFCGL